MINEKMPSLDEMQVLILMDMLTEAKKFFDRHLFDILIYEKKDKIYETVSHLLDAPHFSELFLYQIKEEVPHFTLAFNEIYPEAGILLFDSDDTDYYDDIEMNILKAMHNFFIEKLKKECAMLFVFNEIAANTDEFFASIKGGNNPIKSWDDANGLQY